MLLRLLLDLLYSVACGVGLLFLLLLTLDVVMKVNYRIGDARLRRECEAEEREQTLIEQNGPCCPACGAGNMKRYAFAGALNEVILHFACRGCGARHKLARGGAWELLPPALASREELAERLQCYASHMEPAPEGDAGGPLRSWFGRVCVALPGEGWPQCEGVPMLPLCQINCTELPVRPDALRDIALLCVFIADAGGVDGPAQRDRWALRAYAATDGLVEIHYPGDERDIASYLVTWKVVEDWPDTLTEIPEELWIDRLELRAGPGYSSHALNRIGGYGDIMVARDPARRNRPRQVLQIDVGGRFPWRRGPGGSLVVHRSENSSDQEWWLAWERSYRNKGRSIRRYRLGFENENVELHSFQRLYVCDGGYFFGIMTDGYIGTVRSIRDLRYMVRITSEEHALLFVRLASSGHVPRAEREYEIMTRSEHARTPDWLRTPRNLARYVVLEDVAFRQAGYEPPHVERTGDGFRIVRWMFTPDDDWPRTKSPYPATIQQIAETVDTDGRYTRAVLQRRAVDSAGGELLRASHAPNARQEELLRPGQAQPKERYDELLRPDGSV